MNKEYGSFKKKRVIILFLVLLSFLVLLELDNKYGALLYSKITHKEDMYYIGKLCTADQLYCEKVYFRTYIDQIDAFKNAERGFFENIVIAKDRFGYEGNCPCPYNTDSRGNSCGARSSYSKSGQISYCYGRDISDLRIEIERQIKMDYVRNLMDEEVRKNVDVYKEKSTLLVLIALYTGGVAYFRKRLI